ncbi:hypothetical protein F132_4 [Flavobacterium sp. phage 1/32]|nr:hypothetical protein F132_4 [Flavobacterium sp. phage 1/32]
MDLSEREELIMETIKDYHNTTGGKCGLGFVKLINKTGISLAEIKPILKGLHERKLFHVRDGINDKLFFYGSKKRR